MTDYNIISSQPKDGAAIWTLYRAVAAIEGGLARTADEITTEYVQSFLYKSLTTGISLI